MDSRMIYKLYKTDIAIIGAGIIGCAIARELTKYTRTILVIEKETDVGWGATKANSGVIHAGYAGEKGTLKLNLFHKGNVLFRKYASELDIPVRNTGSLVHAFEKSEIKILEKLLENGRKNGLFGLEIIMDIEKLRKIEPNIKNNKTAALYAKETCITTPYEAAIALFENARNNSVNFLFNSEVTKIISKRSGKHFIIKTPDFDIEAEYIINAAGVFSDDIAQMIGDDSFTIYPVKGEYLLFDSHTDGYVNLVNFSVTTNKSKGVLVLPTISGNFMIGPNYYKTNKYDTSVTKRGLGEVKKQSDRLFLNIPYDKVISGFSGLRAVSDTGDFIIAPSEVNSKFINVAGIQSPGLTCVFVIAERVVDILKDAGVRFKKNKKFIPVRKRPQEFNKNNISSNKRLFYIDKGYGEIICRCEKVTESEIVNAIKNGATTVDGVKFRVRAGMGRCQGGYCMLKVMKIISRELNIPFKKITKSGDGSYIAKVEMK
jgi:glycerol-3-phosphate dehydrogenase